VVAAVSNGIYTHEPCWYRNFIYEEEQARGLDYVEDLAIARCFHWELSFGEAVWILTTDIESVHNSAGGNFRAGARSGSSRLRGACIAADSSRRFERAAEAYIVRGRHGKQSSLAIPGSLTGGATPSSPCADSAIANGRLDRHTRHSSLVVRARQ